MRERVRYLTYRVCPKSAPHGEDGLDFVISFVRDIVDVEASLWMDLNLW